MKYQVLFISGNLKRWFALGPSTGPKAIKINDIYKLKSEPNELKDYKNI